MFAKCLVRAKTYRYSAGSVSASSPEFTNPWCLTVVFRSEAQVGKAVSG